MAVADPLNRFVQELRRRRVPRVTVVYALVGWLVVQVAETAFPYLGLPPWTVTFVIALVVLGFPLAVVLAWAFELTPDGVKRTLPEGAAGTDAAAAVPATGRRAAWRRHGPLAIGVLALLLAGAWLAWGRSDASPPSAAGTVAIFPFAAQTTGEMAYLREGIVTLLARKLEGIAELRPADPRAVLGVVAQAGGGAPDAGSGPAIARRLGAGLFVTGDIVEAGRRLHISATLRGVDSPVPLAQATVEGEADDLFGLVDELAAQLLAGLPALAGGRLARLAVGTTASLDAVKAYLDGERLFRTGRLDSAAAAFRAGIAHDSGFALAYYRLAMTHMADGEAYLPSLREAGRRAGRLGERDRQLVEAASAWDRTDLAAAEALYRRALGRHPDDVETWFWLGELLFHNAPARGQPIAVAAEAWRAVLRYEPDNPSARLHLARIAAFAGDVPELERLAAPYLDGVEVADRRGVELLALHALAAGATPGGVPPTAESRLLEMLRAMPDQALDATLRYLATAAPSPAALLPLVAPGTETSRGAPFRASAHRVAASLHLAGGRLRAAAIELDAARGGSRGESDRTRLALGFAATLPVTAYGGRSAEDARSAARALTAWTGEPQEYSFETPTLYPVLRLYLLGLLALQADDPAAAARWSDSLDAAAAAAHAGMAPRGATGADHVGMAARGRGQSLRAHLARAQGREAAALATLDSIRYALAQFRFEASIEEHDRWLRAALLADAGRTDEALSWLASLAQSGYESAVFLAPSHLRRGQLHEARGDRREAALHYARVLELWRDCDPELRPVVEDVRRRLSSLGEAVALAPTPRTGS
jgi:TolB-like protein